MLFKNIACVLPAIKLTTTHITVVNVLMVDAKANGIQKVLTCAKARIQIIYKRVLFVK